MNSSQNRSTIAEVGEADFESQVLRSKQSVLVEFWAPWSHPCQILGPELEEVAAACADSVKVVRVNADDNPELSLWYEVQSIPTLLCFVSGSVRGRLVGTASKEAILSRLRSIAHGGDESSSTAGEPGT